MSEQMPQANFSTLILSIAHSAKIGLGVAPHPETQKTDTNKQMAQYNIDLLVLLRNKTKDNLTEDENKLLEAMINDLQVCFVQTQ